MCPMLPISLLTILLLAFIEITSAATVKITFQPELINLGDSQSATVTFRSETPLENPKPDERYQCVVKSKPKATATVEKCLVSLNETDNYLQGQFQINGDLIGRANVTLEVKADTVVAEGTVPVVVILRQSVLQKVFLGSVILLVSLNYVNMGCAIDMPLIKETLKKPIGPIVGLASQFGVMPVLSYMTASYFFDEPYLKLGLFTFGCSPGGGASNMWTVLLGGNLDLSVTMTFISTVASLALMPMWLFTLGKTFFKETSPRIPFENIVSGLVGMLIPLGIGLVMQRYCPKGTAFCRKILAPFSIVMILFIIVFGTYANLYMLRLITWEIAFVCALNVWTGFLIGVIVARLFGLPWRDAIAVMVETGIQNTGIAIVLLGVSLPKPEGDMAGIVPVAASSITPIPLTILWLVLRFVRRPKKDKVRSIDTSVDVKILAPLEDSALDA